MNYDKEIRHRERKKGKGIEVGDESVKQMNKEKEKKMTAGRKRRRERGGGGGGTVNRGSFVLSTEFEKLRGGNRSFGNENSNPKLASNPGPKYCPSKFHSFSSLSLSFTHFLSSVSLLLVLCWSSVLCNG